MPVMELVSTKFNRNLLLSILVVGLVLFIRLVDVAIIHNNWRGLIISSIHILIVSCGSYFILKRSGN